MRSKIVIAILAILASVFILLTVALRFSRINEDLRVSAVKIVSSELKHPVEIDALVLNLFPAYVDISGFRVKGRTGDVLFSAVEARAYLSLGDILLHKKINLRQVSIDTPELLVIRDSDNTLNIAPLLDELQRLITGPSKTPYKVAMKELWMRNSAIHYEDRVQNLKADAVKAGGRVHRKPLGDQYDISVWLDEGHLQSSLGKDIPFKAKASLKVGRDGLRVDAAEVSSLRSKLNVSGLTVSGLVSGQSGENARKPSVDGKWELALRLDDWNRLSPRLHGIGGSLAIKGVVGGRLDGLAATGDARGDIVVRNPDIAADVAFSAIKARFAADSNHVSLTELRFSALNGEGSGAAAFSRDPAGNWAYQASWALERGELGALRKVELPGNTHLTGGSVSSRAEISGNFKDPSSLKGRVVFSAAPVMVSEDGLKGKLIGSVKTADGSILFSSAGLVLENIRIESSLYSAAVSGTTGPENQMNLRVSGMIPEVMPVVKEAGYAHLKGRASLDGAITGTADSPVFSGRVAVENALWNGVPVSSAAGDIYLSKERLSSQRIMLRQGDGVYDFRGDIFFKKDIFYDASVRIKNGSPRNVARIFYKELPLDLPSTGELAFRGTSKEFSGDGFLSSPSGDAYGRHFENISVKARLLTDRIIFPAASARRGKERYEGEGEIDWKGNYRMDLSAVNIDASMIDPAFLGLKMRPPVHGIFSVKLSGKGNIDKPRFSVGLESPDARYDKVDLGKLKFEGILADGRVKGNVEIQDKRLVASVDGEAGDGKPWSINAVLKDFSFDPLTRLFAEKTGPLSATASGKAVVSGKGPDISTIRATVDISSLKGDFQGYKAVNDGPLRLDIKGRDVTFENFRLKGRDTSLEVVGNFVAGKTYNLLLRGNAEVNLIKTLTGRLDHAAGNSDIVLSIEGPWTDPDITGIFNLSDAQFKAKDMRYRLTDVNAILIFSRDQVAIQSLTGKAGGGSLSGTGHVELKQFVPESIYLALSVDDFNYRYDNSLAAVLDMRLSYEKTSRGQSINGDVVIDHGRYYKRVDWKSAVLESRKSDMDSMFKFDVPAIGNAALNIHCYSKENFLIDNNLAKIPVRVDLYLRGIVNRPQLLGRLEATSGTVFLRGADYQITSAIIEFSDPNRINPFFNITATTELREYKITMNLSGTPDRFSANVQSDPPLKDIDVIGLLAVGRTGAEEKGEGGGVAAGEAMSFITGQVQNVMEDRIKRIVGFDRFQIDPYAGGAQTSSGAKVTVGKRLLSDRLLVTYTAIMGSTEESVLTVEYKLAKDVSLVGNKDEKGRVKADLRYRFEFR